MFSFICLECLFIWLISQSFSFIDQLLWAWAWEQTLYFCQLLTLFCVDLMNKNCQSKACLDCSTWDAIWKSYISAIHICLREVFCHGFSFLSFAVWASEHIYYNVSSQYLVWVFAMALAWKARPWPWCHPVQLTDWLTHI